MATLREAGNSVDVSWRTLRRLGSADKRDFSAAVFIPEISRSTGQQRTVVHVQRLEEKMRRRMVGANSADGRVHGGYLSGGQPRGNTGRSR